MIDEMYTFAADSVPGLVLTNFHPPEAGFVWSTHAWSEIKFALDEKALSAESENAEAVLDIALDLDVFKAPPDFEGQDVLLYVNGLRFGSRYITGRITVMLAVPLQLLHPTGNVITLDTPQATRPTEHGLGDTRQLGIQLFSVRTTVA